MKLGILGGTFDPIHLMHVHIARAAARTLKLDRTLLVPAHHSPYKSAPPLTPAEHRLAMIRLAIRDYPELDVSDIELKRKGISYTVDTLRSLKDDHSLYLLMGADAYSSFASWKDPETIRRLATLVVFSRPGCPPPQGARTVPVRTRPISSTEIRRKIASGEPIDKLVHPAVRAYIMAQGLYST